MVLVMARASIIACDHVQEGEPKLGRHKDRDAKKVGRSIRKQMPSVVLPRNSKQEAEANCEERGSWMSYRLPQGTESEVAKLSIIDVA